MTKRHPEQPIENLYELRAKHLEMIQSIITRLAGHGVTLKSYCITLATATCGLAATLAGRTWPSSRCCRSSPSRSWMRNT